MPGFHIGQGLFASRDPAGDCSGIAASMGALQSGIDPAQAPSVEAEAEERHEIPEGRGRRTLADSGNDAHHEAR